MKRYTPFKFEEAIDSVQDFNLKAKDIKSFHQVVISHLFLGEL